MQKVTGVPINTVMSELKKLYKPPRSFLHHRTPLDLLVATILSAQCTDDRVNQVTKKLYKKYKKPEDYVSVPRKELEDDIRSCGTYRNKAKFIQGTAKIMIKKHQNKVPDSMEDLIELPGVGRKTAAIILYAVFNKTEGIAVDTHVMRLSQRLGLTRHKTPGKIELDLMDALPKRQWGIINPLLISHGRAVCTARNRKCYQCIFKDCCPSSKARNRKDLAKK